MKTWKNTNSLDDLIEGIELTEEKSKAEVIIQGSKTISLEDFPRLRGIFRAGVSTDNIPNTTGTGVVVQMPSEATIQHIYHETARFAVGALMRCAYSNLGEIEPWRKNERPSLKDQFCLVIGQGKIGSIVSNLLAPILNVLTYDIKLNSKDDLLKFIPRANYITLHLNQSLENNHFIDKDFLAKTSPGVTIVNTSRGSLINESDLLSALKSDQVAMAALDVFEQEPYKGPLTTLPKDKVLLSPHVASNSAAFRKGCAKELFAFIRSLS